MPRLRKAKGCIMTTLDDLRTFARSFQRTMWRRSGDFHRCRLIVTGEYIKTSSRKARP